MWYDCIVSVPPDDEPDWSRVPEEKRELVRQRWLNANKPEAERCLMWGPQVDWFRSMGYDITVEGPSDYRAGPDQLPPRG